MTAKKTNWEAIKAEFLAGKLSNRQIGNAHGLSEGAIRKRAKADGWVRTKRDVAYQTLPITISHDCLAGQDRFPIPEDPIEHGESIAKRLLGELDTVTSHVGELEQMIESETAGDQNGRRREAMMKAISLPARSMTLRTVAQSLAILKETGSVGGKKKEREDAAKKVSVGRFARKDPPKLVINNS